MFTFTTSDTFFRKVYEIQKLFIHFPKRKFFIVKQISQNQFMDISKNSYLVKLLLGIH